MKTNRLYILLVVCSIGFTTKPVGGYSSEEDCKRDCQKGECRYIGTKYQCLISSALKKSKGF